MSNWVNPEVTKYQRLLLNRLGYFAVSTTRIIRKVSSRTSRGEWSLIGTTIIAKLIYWTFHLNAVVKAIFLGFLVMDYFGPVGFLDKIAALDYILCFALVVITGLIWFRRYPFYEILQANWKILSLIYEKVGYPVDQIAKVNRDQKSILLTHFAIIWIGCSCLTIQYFADPKYCTFTYSIVPMDSLSLRVLFAVHEFLFMNLAWNAYAGSCSLCIFQGISLSNILNQMSETLGNLFKDKRLEEKLNTAGAERNNIMQSSVINPKHVAVGTEYDIDKLLFDYKQLMLINMEFNEWVSYKTLFLHICGGCQFVSDVFAGIHVLKMPGTGFMDVWFYIEDCFAAGFILIRTYVFMSSVWTSSNRFLSTLKQYLTFPNPKRLYLKRVAKSLRVVTLNVGPCSVSPISVLTIIDTMGNYYVCAALW